MKRCLLGLFLLFYTIPTLPIISGVSCLYNPKTGQKLALLYDIHYEFYFDTHPALQELIKEQADSLVLLVRKLSKKTQKSSFFSEFHDRLYLDPEDKPVTLTTVGLFFAEVEQQTQWLPFERRFWLEEGNTFLINDETEVRHDMIGSLTLNRCDHRNEIDFFAVQLAEELPLCDELEKQEVRDSYASSITSVTLDRYQQHIDLCYNQLRNKLEQLSVPLRMHYALKHELDTLYQKIKSRVEEGKGKGISLLFDFVLWCIDHQANDVIDAINQLSSRVCFDIELLFLVDTNEFQYSIVHAGSAHADLLKERLQQLGWLLISEHGIAAKPMYDNNEQDNCLEQYCISQVNNVPRQLDSSVLNFFNIL